MLCNVDGKICCCKYKYHFIRGLRLFAPLSGILAYIKKGVRLWRKQYVRYRLERERVPTPSMPDALLPVPYLSQENGYPTGCESVSTAMLLQYWNIPIDVDTFIDRYLDKGSLYEKDGKRYGPHPADCFVGDPRRSEGFGCYAPVIERALNHCLPMKFRVENVTGTALRELAARYIDKGIPVLIWATIGLLEPGNGIAWIDIRTGGQFQWITQEHCMVLTGYSEEAYACNDPYGSQGKVWYRRKALEKRFMQMGSQALVVTLQV